MRRLFVSPVLRGGGTPYFPAQDERIGSTWKHQGGGQASAAEGQALSWLFLQLGDLVGNAVVHERVALARDAIRWDAA